jgi:preflagellin peptidase FlaK
MEDIPLLLGLVVGFLTSYTDIKTGFIFDNHVSALLPLIERTLGVSDEDGELPLPRWMEKVPIPAIELGVLYYAYLGIEKGDPLLALSGLVGLLVGLFLGLFLFYIGAWASGDAVVLATFSALLPFPPESARFVAPYYSSLPLYPIAILFNSIISVFPFILAYSIGVAVWRGHWAELKEIFVKNSLKVLEVSLWIFAAAWLWAEFMSITGLKLGGLVSWIVVFFLVALLGKVRVLGDAAGVVALAYSLYTSSSIIWAFLKLLTVLYLFKVLIAVVNFLRREVLVEEVPVEELREWDILGEVIHEKDGTILRDRTEWTARFRKALTSGNPSLLRPNYGNVIASPTAEGLTREQIERLKKLVEEGKLENRFLRKKAMPFAPAIFLGFLISYFWGDIFWWLELKVMGL